DTGMGRIGFRNTEDLKEAVDFIEKHSDQLKCEGVFTHFSTADSKDPAYFEKQSQKFDELVGVLKKKPKYIHQANSATALWHPNFEGNLVRMRSEEHTSELQSRFDIVCRLLLENKNKSIYL